MTGIFWAVLVMLTGTRSFAADDLDQPPAAGAPREIKLPEPVEKTLANGLRVIVIERPGLPILSAQFVVKSGAEVDPADGAGAMDMLASLLMRGAGQRTAPQLAQAIEALGGAITTGAGWDATAAKLTIMTAQAEAGLEILREVVRRPTLAAAEVERLRAETLDELRVKMEEPGTLAKAAAARVIFGDGPYGHLPGGTPKSVAHISRARLAKLHATYFRPDNAVLIFVGSLKAEQGFAWAGQFFGDWKKPAVPLPALRVSEPPAKPRVVIIDMPNAGQAAVVVGKAAVARKAPDYFPGVVASSVLGGGYSARLNAEIRVKRGLTYGASSDLGARRLGGAFVAAAQTKNSAGPEVAVLMRAELDRLATEPVPAAELTPRTSTLTGEYGRALETNDGFATRLAGLAVLDLPLTALSTFTADVLAVKVEAVQKFAGDHLRGVATSVVIAGHAESFRDTLGDTFKDAEVIPQKALDLDSISLREPTKAAKGK
ncbi:MAG: insulinase family protein [Chthoniobacter sp.]|nr:insulinase family protein [Chthoniobacter sp.]